MILSVIMMSVALIGALVSGAAIQIAKSYNCYPPRFSIIFLILNLGLYTYWWIYFLAEIGFIK